MDLYTYEGHNMFFLVKMILKRLVRDSEETKMVSFHLNDLFPWGIFGMTGWLKVVDLAAKTDYLLIQRQKECTNPLQWQNELGSGAVNDNSQVSRVSQDTPKRGFVLINQLNSPQTEGSRCVTQGADEDERGGAEVWSVLTTESCLTEL